ncbi:UNVERIFIED_CONTAM: hypothetical protein RMT77_001290 [Armadillidium vulgare]
MKVISLSIVITAIICTASAQTLNEECSINVENITVEQLIAEVPADWTFGCMTKNLLLEYLGNKDYVNTIIECLHPDVPVCPSRGYEVIADEVFKRIDEGGKCTSCSKRTDELVDFALKLMQQNHPRELRTLLSYLG